MMTAAALMETGTTEKGAIPAFWPPGEEGQPAGETQLGRKIDARRRDMIASIFADIEMLREIEPREDAPGREDVYMGLRRIADQYKGELRNADRQLDTERQPERDTNAR